MIEYNQPYMQVMDMKNFIAKQLNSGAVASIWNCDALECYCKWPSPTAIIVDGPYGVGGFPGDSKTVDTLPQWYAAHIAAWSAAAKPNTTLWFWGTELGWATVHPILLVNGWDYQEANVWDKGIGHIAGNINSKTIRKTPVVTEVCVRYTKKVLLPLHDGTAVPIKEWLRAEWKRTGLPLSKTNEACGVKNAATRKYFTADGLWYFPPADAMEKLSLYANQHGIETPNPYLSIDGKTPVTAEQWQQMRAKWNYKHGVTNVWHIPALHNAERLKKRNGKSLHYNQKPKEIINYLIETSTDRGDVVWDPFAGLATVGVCSLDLGRKCYCAEIMNEVYQNAVQRLQNAIKVELELNGDVI
jgi:site-specific DNA-methyltransferase (adenine-specific)